MSSKNKDTETRCDVMGWWGMFRYVQIGANNYVSKCWFFYKQYLETRTWSKMYMVKVVIFDIRLLEEQATEFGKVLQEN